MVRLDRVGSLAVLMVAAAFVSGCDEKSKYTKIEPAQVEKVSGSKLKKITLTPKAIERTDVQTVVVRETSVASSGAASPVMRQVVPYSSIIYDYNGGTWVYTSPKAREFIRHEIEIDYIDGDNVVLKSGPPNDTTIATVGAAELYGTEVGMGK